MDFKSQAVLPLVVPMTVTSRKSSHLMYLVHYSLRVQYIDVQSYLFFRSFPYPKRYSHYGSRWCSWKATTSMILRQESKQVQYRSGATDYPCSSIGPGGSTLLKILCTASTLLVCSSSWRFERSSTIYCPTILRLLPLWSSNFAISSSPFL